MEVNGVSSATGGALSKVSPEDTQLQHHVKSSSSDFTSDHVQMIILRSGPPVVNYVDSFVFKVLLVLEVHRIWPGRQCWR